jgi:hypothetical protein
MTAPMPNLLLLLQQFSVAAAAADKTLKSPPSISAACLLRL